MDNQGSIIQQTLGSWMLTSSAAGTIADPVQLAQSSLPWIPNVPVPGTVAQALRAAGQWNYDSTIDLDTPDWWYRCTFAHDTTIKSAPVMLLFNGLATLATVWVNRQKILQSDNMFLNHEVDVGPLLTTQNELVICFHSLNAALQIRRPRPRWKTRLVADQQLRWFRTTLLGRMLGISPIIAPVGPWRPIELQHRPLGTLLDSRIQTSLIGSAGVVSFSASIQASLENSISGTLSVGNVTSALAIQQDDSSFAISCSAHIPDVELWWPHTHGKPQLYKCSVVLTIDSQIRTIDLGEIGFRRIVVDQQGGQFALRINDTPVFCRGACWTVNDIVSLGDTEDELIHTLRLLKQAGGNMVKVGGTMVYQSNKFYRICDELGIMVWQDFMFSNMDYPFENADFRKSVIREVHQQLNRLRTHASITVYCGNSDVELQASMVGVPRAEWRNSFFAETLPSLLSSEHPDIPYVPSSPSGGDMPFHVGSGISHYYAVSAFMQPISRVRGDAVQFASESLGFAHIPEPEVVNEIFGGDLPMLLDPRWKQRVARNHGFNYDFDDVRDAYLKQLFSIDPRELRICDTARYLAISRIVPGEVLLRVFSEWRRPQSSCRGALIWYLKDFWPGAGLGLLDSHGNPKASYFFAHRAWQPKALLLSDEGFDGVKAHVINESVGTFSGTLELMLLRDGNTIVAKGSREVSVATGNTFSISSDVLLDGFYDVAYVYRIGPPHHDVVVGTLLDKNGYILTQAFYFPLAQEPARVDGATVLALATHTPDGISLKISTDRFLFAVRIDVPGYLPQDNYFHLAPGRPRNVLCSRTVPETVAFKGYVEALNMQDAVKIQVNDN